MTGTNMAYSLVVINFCDHLGQDSKHGSTGSSIIGAKVPFHELGEGVLITS